MEVQTLYIPQLSQLQDSEKKYLITRGGQQVTWFPFTAQSASDSSFTFKLDPPSPSTVLDRNLILEVDFTMVLKGKPKAKRNILESGSYALRAYPFSSCVDTLTCIINGQSITVQLSNIVHMLSRYNNTSESRTSFQSIFPNTLDMYQNYDTGRGDINNPLNPYGSSLPGTYAPRGAYPLTVTGNAPNPEGDNNTERTATITGKIFEYVNISPFYSRSQEGTGGLANIQNLTLNFNMSNLGRMLSMSLDSLTSGELDSLVVSLGTTPKIYCGHITKPVDFEIPRTLNFSYNDYSYYGITSGGTVANGATATITSNVIQWSQLPEKIYVCVRKRTMDTISSPSKLVTSTNTYCAITGVNINFANHDGIQSSTPQVALYMQSVRNGCNMSFVEWTGTSVAGPAVNTAGTSSVLRTVGSVLAFELGKDIPLQGLDAPAMSGSWNFQIRVTFDNIMGEEIIPELAIVAVFDGILTVEYPGQAYISLGIVTPEMTLQAPDSDMDYDDIQRVYGGKFGSNIKRFFKNNAPMLRNVGKAVGSIVAPKLTQSLTGIVDQGRDIVRAAQEDARAMTQAQGAALQGGLRAGMSAGLRAGALHGGEVIPKSTLRSRAR